MKAARWLEAFDLPGLCWDRWSRRQGTACRQPEPRSWRRSSPVSSTRTVCIGDSVKEHNLYACRYTETTHSEISRPLNLGRSQSVSQGANRGPVGLEDSAYSEWSSGVRAEREPSRKYVLSILAKSSVFLITSTTVNVSLLHSFTLYDTL